MTFSFTGLAYLIGLFALGLLSYRFFQYWQREKTTISKLFMCFTGTFALFMLILATAGLFFANNTQILRLAVISTAFVQNFAFAIIAYLLVYLKFPRISPWLGAIPVFLLAVVTTILTATIPFNPYLESSGGINWDIQPVGDIIRLFLFLITFVPLLAILIQQIRIAKDPAVKNRALGIVLILVFGILVSLLDFFLESILKLEAISSDIAMVALSIVVFIIVFFIPKPPSPTYVTKVYEEKSF